MWWSGRLSQEFFIHQLFKILPFCSHLKYNFTLPYIAFSSSRLASSIESLFTVQNSDLFEVLNDNKLEKYPLWDWNKKIRTDYNFNALTIVLLDYVVFPSYQLLILLGVYFGFFVILVYSIY